MSDHVFVIDASLLASAGPGSCIELTGPEGRHAASVVRVRNGESIHLVDGLGRRAHAVVSAAGRDQVSAVVRSILVEPAPDPAYVVVQALPKGEHAELAVDLMTQVGADAIIPWSAARCVAHWSADRAERGRARWQQAAQGAAKQSRRSWIPSIEPLATTEQVIERVRQADLAIVLDAEAADALAQTSLPSSGAIVVVVGPEGGLAPAEAEQLAATGAMRTCLGPTVLRTSLAGAAAITVLSARQRWHASHQAGGSGPSVGG